MSFDTISPWGTWRARGVAAHGLWLLSILPRNYLCRRLATLFRKPVKAGRQSQYDREIWGLRLRLSARGNFTEQRWLMMERFHDWPERVALRDALKSGGVFVDVGANAGFYTFWAVAQGIRNLRVIAVEPSPTLLERLRFNLATNQLGGVVRVYDCAVTAVPSEVTLVEHTVDLGQTGVSTGLAGIRALGRPLLDLIMESGVERVDVLKIDIEGQEIPVLEAFFRAAPAALWPDLIIGEISGEHGDEFLELLVRHGYTLTRKTVSNGMFQRRCARSGSSAKAVPAHRVMRRLHVSYRWRWQEPMLCRPQDGHYPL